MSCSGHVAAGREHYRKKCRTRSYICNAVARIPTWAAAPTTLQTHCQRGRPQDFVAGTRVPRSGLPRVFVRALACISMQTPGGRCSCTRSVRSTQPAAAQHSPRVRQPFQSTHRSKSIVIVSLPICGLSSPPPIALTLSGYTPFHIRQPRGPRSPLSHLFQLPPFHQCDLAPSPRSLSSRFAAQQCLLRLDLPRPRPPSGVGSVVAGLMREVVTRMKCSCAHPFLVLPGLVM